ncbi:MAG: rhodanese-related sulfurtransferase [uncultured archaeon A07HB70]|nr:MAG: rhodanese-related sulfurtransferase [uncultured archaeon A07HB70]
MNETVPSVTPAELDACLRAGDPVVVLDVRARDEFERWHVTAPSVETRHASHAKFVAAGVTGDVAARARDLGLDQSDRVVVVCGHGAASDEVAGLLADAGFDAANLTGGMAAWADLLVATPVPGPDDPTVVQYRRPSSGCLSYLVVSGDEAAVVDPLRAFAGRYAADAADHGADVAFAVDTHVHADHASGVVALAARTDATAVLPARATDRGLDRSVDARLLGPDETLAVGETTLAAVPLPGHTTEMTGLRLDREGASVLFCGDSASSTPSPDPTSRPATTARRRSRPACTRRSTTGSSRSRTRRSCCRATTRRPTRRPTGSSRRASARRATDRCSASTARRSSSA